MIRQTLSIYALRAGAVLVLVGLWLYSNGPGGVSKLLLPDLGRVITDFGTMVLLPEFWQATGVTVVEILSSFAVGGALGVLVGFWGARTELRRRIVEPVTIWGYMAPLVLFYPLFILWFDIGMSSKITFGAFNTFFPVAYGALRAFSSVEQKYLVVARAFGASRFQTDFVIKLPGALPLLASSLRIGVAMSVITVILSEMLAATDGLGYMLAFSSQTFAMAKAFAIILAILIVVGIFQAGVNRVFTFDRSKKMG